MSNLTVAEYISEFLEQKQIKSVFQLSGGMITQLIDSIAVKNVTSIHSLFHEQSCAFAVSAYGRLQKKPSVAFATSGPGATNLITGIGDCYYDSVPAIFITGQVNTFELKGNSNVRQLGFQETDIISMIKPITKLAVQLTNSEDLPDLLETLYQTSISDRPGPVLLDIPMNLQRGLVKKQVSRYPKINKDADNLNDHILNVVQLLKSAKKPLIWAGNGIHTSNSESLFKEFIDLTQIPTVLTLHGVDLLPHHHPSRIGMIGSYGNRWANITVKEADLILFLGSRIDIRQTGANLNIFNNKTLIRVDCDSAELINRLLPEIAIKLDVNQFLSEILKIQTTLKIDSQWINYIEFLKKEHPIEKEFTLLKNEIGPHQILRAISSCSPINSIYTVDVGAHQMWAAQCLEFKTNHRFLTSGGMGAMGFSIPAAIGAAISNPDSTIIVIVGDGSFQMNIQELQYIFTNQLNVKILVINNESLGMIRQFQDSYMNGRYFGTKWGYSVPNICAVSSAFGIESKTVNDFSDVISATQWLFNDKIPKLLEFKMRSDIDVYPKIAFGQTMDKMEPDFVPNDIEST